MDTLEPNLAPEPANNVWQVASSNLDKIGSRCNTSFLRKQNLESRTMQGKGGCRTNTPKVQGLFNALLVPLPVIVNHPVDNLCFSFGATLTMSSMTLFGNGRRVGGGVSSKALTLSSWTCHVTCFQTKWLNDRDVHSNWHIIWMSIGVGGVGRVGRRDFQLFTSPID